MDIAVMGAGGVGGYFGGMLAKAGHDVTFIARGDHLRAIKSSGLRVVHHGGENSLSQRKSRTPRRPLVPWTWSCFA